MKQFILGLVLVATFLAAQVFFTQTANAASARFDCDPSFRGGYYGSRCPPRAMHPEQDKYPGHSYHTIRIRLVVNDPSGIDDRTYTDTMYCDCGRATSKCRITADYTPSAGRTGRFIGPNSNSAAGGSNDGSSTLTFNYQLDPLPPYELRAGISKNSDTVLPGGVITWTHTATRVSGETSEAVSGSSGTQRKGPMTSSNATDDTKTRLRTSDNNVQNSGLPTQVLTEGGVRERVCAIGNFLCSDRVRDPWPYRDVSGSIYPKSGSRPNSSFTSTLTVGRDTPEGTEFCRQTVIDKAKYNGRTTYTADRTGFECVKVRTDATTRYSLTPKVDMPSDRVFEPGSSVPITPTVTNGGPAQSRSTEWEVTRVILPPGINLGAKENGGDSAEAACGAYLRPAPATGGSCSVIDRGANVFTRINIADPIKQLAPQLDDLPIGTRFCFALSVKPPTNESSANNTWRHSELECVKVGKRPKVQIHGGDLMVGRTFNGVTPPATLASIVNTSNALRGGKTFGSWTEYAISAPGVVTNAGSAAGLAGGSAGTAQSNWSKLTFANTPTFGEYGSVSGSIPDVVSAVRSLYDIDTAPRIGGNVQLTSGTSVIQVASSDIALSSNATFGASGQTVVVYAPDHTVTIASNISYSSNAMTSIRDIPQLIIIADDIAINSNVDRVDGWLIAQGDSGVINTCADVTTGLSAAVCNNQLTVNGPTAAKNLLLRRTAGSTTGDDAARSAPAEVFNLRADAYLWAHGIDNDSRRVITTYTSELPPRF